MFGAIFCVEEVHRLQAEAFMLLHAKYQDDETSPEKFKEVGQ